MPPHSAKFGDDGMENPPDATNILYGSQMAFGMHPKLSTEVQTQCLLSGDFNPSLPLSGADD
jgi:hypothetical protein